MFLLHCQVWCKALWVALLLKCAINKLALPCLNSRNSNTSYSHQQDYPPKVGLYMSLYIYAMFSKFGLIFIAVRQPFYLELLCLKCKMSISLHTIAGSPKWNGCLMAMWSAKNFKSVAYTKRDIHTLKYMLLLVLFTAIGLLCFLLAHHAASPYRGWADSYLLQPHTLTRNKCLIQPHVKKGLTPDMFHPKQWGQCGF